MTTGRWIGLGPDDSACVLPSVTLDGAEHGTQVASFSEQDGTLIAVLTDGRIMHRTGANGGWTLTGDVAACLCGHTHAEHDTYPGYERCRQLIEEYSDEAIEWCCCERFRPSPPSPRGAEDRAE